MNLSSHSLSTWVWGFKALFIDRSFDNLAKVRKCVLFPVLAYNSAITLQFFVCFKQLTVFRVKRIRGKLKFLPELNPPIPDSGAVWWNLESGSTVIAESSRLGALGESATWDPLLQYRCRLKGLECRERGRSLPEL